MSQRILIRYATGSKASTVQEFPVTAGRELLFGRDCSCDVRFDEERDEFASRRHMKLIMGDPGRTEYTVVDLAASNGTFVNRRRVTGSARLHPGDVVQLGAGGPEFTFDVVSEDLRITPPVPAEDLNRTVAETTPPSEVPRPEEAPPVNVPPPPDVSRPVASTSARASGRRPVVYRRKFPKRTTRKNTAAGLVFLVLTVATAWWFMGSHRTPGAGGIGAAARSFVKRASKFFRRSDTLTPEQVAVQSTESLVIVENVWRLVDPATARPLKQIYVPNSRELSDNSGAPLISNAGRDLPVFVLLAGNRLLPLLTVADQSSNRAIGGSSRGTGFVVASDGVILTSRSVTSPWRSPYDWPLTDTAGIVAVFDEKLRLAKTAIIARRQFPRWLPMDTDFALENSLDQNSVRVSSAIHGRGVSDSLNVHISTRRLDVSASLVKESDATGFAAIRLDPQAVTRCMAMATEDSPKVGDELVMVASPDSRPGVGKLSSIDAGGRYHLVADTTEPGGPAAPVFDRHGLVVAVQATSDPLRPDRAFAIPIRRALESVGQATAQQRSRSAF